MILNLMSHHPLRRTGLCVLGLAATLVLGGCVSPGGKIAGLGPTAAPPIDKATSGKLAKIDPNGTLPGVAVANNLSRGYTDPRVAALNSGTPVDTGMATAGAHQANPAGEGQSPTANLGELINQPTTVSANRNSLFANPQTAYAPEAATATNPNSGSIVPQDMPTRRGINPSFASVYSAPRPTASPAYPMAEPMEPQAAPAPAPTPELAYDPAEPVAQPAPATSAAGKRFSLMRMLGKSGS